MVTMKQAKKLYRGAHGKRTACPRCSGSKDAHAKLGCRGPLTFIAYPQTSPGLRAFVRRELQTNQCAGKLAAIMGQASDGG